MLYHVYPLKLYSRKVPVVIMLSTALALNLFSWFWLLLQIPWGAEQVFLHYNILFGVDSIGKPLDVYITPLIGLVLLVGNFIAGWILYRKDWFFSYTMLCVGVVVNIFIAITSVLVVFLNI